MILKKQQKKFIIAKQNGDGGMTEKQCIYCESNLIYNDYENKNGIRWRCLNCLKEFMEWKKDGDTIDITPCGDVDD